MIGHEDEIAQVISFAIEMFQSVGHGVRNGALFQQALAESTIQILHKSPRECCMELLFKFGLVTQLNFPFTTSVKTVVRQPLLTPKVPGAG